MTRYISDLAMLYVDNRELPYQVRMYTDEHSEVCRIEFGNSFTLNVVDPLMLETFIQELKEFADAAHELHYGIQAQRVEALGEEMAQLQQKLEDCGVEDWGSVEEESDEFYSNLIDQNLKKAADAREPSKVERLMRGTVSAPQIDPMNDPMNW